MSRPGRWVPTVVVAFLIGCTAERSGVSSLPVATAAMPQLELVHAGSAVNDSIDDRWMKIDVDDRGRIAITPGQSFSPRIRFVDSTGHFSGGAGPIGPGPGELGFPPRIWWSDSGLVAYENNRRVQIRYDQDGRLTGEQPTQEGFVPVTASPEGVVEFTHSWRERKQSPALTLRAYTPRKPNVLLDDRQPQLRRALEQEQGLAITYPWPVVAVDRGVLALVEPRTPIVWYFNLAGELLDSVALAGVGRHRGPTESAEELATYARSAGSGTRGPDGKRYPGPDLDSLQTLFKADRPPIAFIHGANFDGRGRLWIIGQHNDSTRALVLSGTRLLGQLMLPCFRVGRFVAVSNRWVALLCSNGEGADPPFALQLYRIVEPVSKLP
jgi:hypothetical protein